MDIKKRIGYVPQHSQLFNRTVYENIIYGHEGMYSRKDIENIIAKMDLAKEFASLADGIDTRVGKNGQMLSGGQRQLVWCLRVLLQRPDVVVMDEPTASLDEESKHTLWRMLKMLMRGKTVIIVTHDEFVKRIATRTIHIQDGKVVLPPPVRAKN
jgi:ABC-type multidrug transport system fused ATPase/permease subunit